MSDSGIDPATAAMLAAIAALELPALQSLSPAQARAGVLAMAPKVNPRPLFEVRDQFISEALKVRIYRPTAESNLPVVVFYHGGGWVVCDLDTHDALAREIAVQSHCVVVSVDYRLAPEHKFPTPLDDAYAALCWVAAQSKQLGVDKNKVVVAGDSAGGNLAAAVCIRARDLNGPSIFHQCLWYPVTDVRAMNTASYQAYAEGYYLRKDDMRWFAAHYLAREEQAFLPSVSPLANPCAEGLPPAQIVTAGFDVLRDEGYEYAALLTKVGVSVDYQCFDQLIHGFLTQAQVLPSAATARQVVLSKLHALLWCSC